MLKQYHLNCDRNVFYKLRKQGRKFYLKLRFWSDGISALYRLDVEFYVCMRKIVVHDGEYFARIVNFNAFENVINKFYPLLAKHSSEPRKRSKNKITLE